MGSSFRTRWNLLFITPGCTWGYSYSTPIGVGPFPGPFPRFHLGLFIFNPYRGCGPSPALPQVSPGAIISLRSGRSFIFNPYRGWALPRAFPQVSPGAIISLRELLRFIFNPYRGWGVSRASPQVSPGAIISLRSGRSFIFNPYRGWGVSRASPQVAPGAIISLRSGRSFIFNPYRGWRVYPRLHLGLFIFNPYGVGALDGYWYSKLESDFHNTSSNSFLSCCGSMSFKAK
jgi:hypothetical protein